MIKAHPTHAMLRAFVADELPLPLAVGVSAHSELCAECRARLRDCEAELATLHLADSMPPAETGVPEWDAMLATILQQPTSPEVVVTSPAPELRVAGQDYRLPRALARYHTAEWRQIGAIRQHRLPLAERGARASLLHIEAGGSIPAHTHEGYELTLLLAGSMQEGEVRYQAGDFILRDASHCHGPHTQDGCLCYTVQDAPIRFTKGLPRLLNGFSHRFY
ncbi:ChrR family anti-sigma-E factor [Aeromonas lusitana]|uniref:Transcriptional regulator n=1 Tax=Aeromonas lusitana TaxID=931529 RepID=A0A2M8H9B7_9GAMM|nr:ChrR family anti-sigma-E factor [Aeromonas lusitana]PJC93164.1 transcriptional regulator [Aeromonas lusitana]